MLKKKGSQDNREKKHIDDTVDINLALGELGIKKRRRDYDDLKYSRDYDNQRVFHSRRAYIDENSIDRNTDNLDRFGHYQSRTYRDQH